jgi:hypothetical protein
MALAKGRNQAEAVRGPQWRPTRLDGISAAADGAMSVQLLAGRERQRPGAGDIRPPMAGCLKRHACPGG